MILVRLGVQVRFKMFGIPVDTRLAAAKDRIYYPLEVPGLLLVGVAVVEVHITISSEYYQM